MKKQEISIYREIQKNTQMAMKAIDTISDKVHDEELAMEIARQAIQYSEIHNQAAEKLLEARAEPYHGNHLEDIALKGAIHYNTLLNTSTGHIAELMIKGSNQGILGMNKALNHNETAGERTVSLAKQLISAQEKHVDTLKKYL